MSAPSPIPATIFSPGGKAKTRPIEGLHNKTDRPSLLGWGRISFASEALLSRSRPLLLEIVSRVVEQTARDDQTLNLAGTFVDVRDAAIPHPLLEQQLPGDADGS